MNQKSMTLELGFSRLEKVPEDFFHGQLEKA